MQSDNRRFIICSVLIERDFSQFCDIYPNIKHEFLFNYEKSNKITVNHIPTMVNGNPSHSPAAGEPCGGGFIFGPPLGHDGLPAAGRPGVGSTDAARNGGE